MVSKPIPRDAHIDDPIWHGHLLELANDLILAGAKGKIIERFTGLPHKRVALIYKELIGEPMKSGGLAQQKPAFFAKPKVGGYVWVHQCGTFLQCYRKLEKQIGMPVNRGWLLLKAHQTYLVVTRPLHDADERKQLDINQAYTLLVHSSNGKAQGNEEIRLVTCKTCQTSHLILSGAEQDTQACPICAMNQNFLRLVEQANLNKKAEDHRAQLAV